jgi:RHS repeat-associated protein
VTLTCTSTHPDLAFGYDAGGNRLWKKVIPKGVGETVRFYYYIRDAQGNEMARYQQYTNASSETLFISEEHSLYGSARIGVDGRKDTLYKAGAYNPACCGTQSARRELGRKQYELTNHLGNVLASMTDKKAYKTISGSIYFEAEITTLSDYYPFGSAMQTRGFAAGGYRFGFNGKEEDDESISVYTNDYGFRIYSASLCKFLSIDPLNKRFPWWSPYHFAGNTPVQAIDLDGGEPKSVAVPGNDGKTHLTYPVIAMFARLYGPEFWHSGFVANIQINQVIHDRLTGYKDGAITLGFEMIFTQNYASADVGKWLKLIAHEKVHVRQFQDAFGINFNKEQYSNAIGIWMLSYCVDVVKVYDSDKSDREMHDAIPIEREANEFEAKFVRFYDSHDFVRKRNINGKVMNIPDNRVENLLTAMADSKHKYDNATTVEEKQKQKIRCQANFDCLMKLVDEFNKKEATQQVQNKQEGSD